MQRYILRFRGGAMPPIDVARIKGQYELTVVDESRSSLLVEAPEDELEDLILHMPGWIMAQERMLSIPETRPQLKSGPVRTAAAPRPRPAASTKTASAPDGKSTKRPRRKQTDD